LGGAIRRPGFYPEQVFTALAVFHSLRYGSVSRPLRAKFDDAGEQSADDNFDLLHDDGCHNCGAMRHDVETWWPKSSPHKVVLFHETHEQMPDFGVWQAWAEFNQTYGARTGRGIEGCVPPG